MLLYSSTWTKSIIILSFIKTLSAQKPNGMKKEENKLYYAAVFFIKKTAKRQNYLCFSFQFVYLPCLRSYTSIYFPNRTLQQFVYNTFHGNVLNKPRRACKVNVCVAAGNGLILSERSRHNDTLHSINQHQERATSHIA